MYVFFSQTDSPAFVMAENVTKTYYKYVVIGGGIAGVTCAESVSESLM